MSHVRSIHRYLWRCAHSALRLSRGVPSWQRSVRHMGLVAVSGRESSTDSQCCIDLSHTRYRYPAMPFGSYGGRSYLQYSLAAPLPRLQKRRALARRRRPVKDKRNYARGPNVVTPAYKRVQDSAVCDSYTVIISLLRSTSVRRLDCCDVSWSVLFIRNAPLTARFLPVA